MTTPHHDAAALLEAELERLREALRFYADEGNWAEQPLRFGWREPAPTFADRGQRAREALLREPCLIFGETT